MISLQHVSRRYNDFIAVGNVSFSIKQGEIVGLLGHNGAGKTTIMKMLTGFLEPSAGDICIDQYDIASQTAQAQALIGYLPENLPVYPEMIVVDYLDYCARMRDLHGKSTAEAVRIAIEKTDLAEKALKPISTLSRGFKQRVGVAQALLHSPKLLILDEPTNGLDPHQTHQMRDLIKQLAVEATVILSTHIMQEVDALCDRVIILDQGRLAVDSSLEELRQCDALHLSTTADENLLISILTSINANTHFSRINVQESLPKEANSYRLPVQSQTNISQLCADLAKALIDKGAQLFQLSPQHRDLETVFRAIQLQRTEASHAA